jgi:hypothetical protein
MRLRLQGQGKCLKYEKRKVLLTLEGAQEPRKAEAEWLLSSDQDVVILPGQALVIRGAYTDTCSKDSELRLGCYSIAQVKKLKQLCSQWK